VLVSLPGLFYQSLMFPLLTFFAINYSHTNLFGWVAEMNAALRVERPLVDFTQRLFYLSSYGAHAASCLTHAWDKADRA
jgi:hypothetical protein